MAIGDIYQVTVSGTLHGQLTNSVLHYRETVSGGADGSVQLATAIDATLAGVSFRANASSEWRYDFTVSQRIRPLPILLAVTVNLNAGAGQAGSNSLPSSVASVIRKRTALAGRKFRGRTYIPGVPSAVEVDSQLTAAGLTALQTLATQMAGTVGIGAWDFAPVIFHRATGTSTLITACVATAVLRNQRRRQIGKGA